MTMPFNSPYAHGFDRAAVATPRVRVADPRHNARQVLDLAQAAADDHAALVVFLELALSGYSNEDLFFQDAVLDGVLAAVGELAQRTRELEATLVEEGFAQYGCRSLQIGAGCGSRI